MRGVSTVNRGKPIMKKLIYYLSSAALVIAMTGCGRSSSSGTYAANSYYDSAAESESYYGLADEAAGYAPAEMKTEGNTTTASGQTENPTAGEKLVYRGAINLETMSYEETVKAVHERIDAYHGIIEQENSWDNDRSWTYADGRKRTMNRTLSLTLRIPTESFQSFMNDMEGTAKVTSKSQSVENISRKYNDNSIEIESLRVQQERLMNMMESAETVEEMIMVEERLSEVQTRLNQKLSYQSSMDKDVQYSTISLNVNEVQEYTPVDDSIPIGGFGKRLKETAEYSWTYFVYFMQNLVLFLIRILPFVLVIGLIIFLITRYRKAKGLNPNPFARVKKEEKDWKAYAEEKRAQLNAKKEARQLEKELNTEAKDSDKRETK